MLMILNVSRNTNIKPNPIYNGQLKEIRGLERN